MGRASEAVTDRGDKLYKLEEDEENGTVDEDGREDIDSLSQRIEPVQPVLRVQVAGQG